MQLIIAFAFIILAHFAVSAPTERFAGHVLPQKSRNFDIVRSDVDTRSKLDITYNVFPCKNPESCPSNTAKSVRDKALERRVGPGGNSETKNNPQERFRFRKGCRKAAERIAEGFSACMGRGTSAVEGEAAELVVDAQQAKNRKTKKTKQQQSQLGTPKPYNEGLVNKAVGGLQRIALVTGVKAWDAFIKVNDWRKNKYKQRAERKQNKAALKSGQEGRNGGPNQAPESQVPNEIPNPES
ncbi:hypothetical protein MCOR07_003825 [Pyricularia oryzae]|uniref:Uncharacterized protein n=2 Tax=Pyricularia TaxID=48558 RepID=A0ABQ8P1Y9_PYRGI|nr:hypothetical protein MCOR01_000244 [Pyricularia oryzae]KAI6304836.1 hypothetical protein MCOR33_000347 [Pyricularia grisea]KAI6287630.1 hypothetical protein MCOR26_000528 [Pyricularia oryzae]KAI6387823.1 hypothetical protein MCOR32_000456 [Pyricularia oryzae]KAI6397026.1 hypothetical protein MCOR23_006372 [Pyricularia oryzae]